MSKGADFSQDQTLKWMDNIRHTVEEILSVVNTQGQITLGEAERIAKKHGAALHNALAELESRCRVDYSKGIILCQR